MLLNWNIRGAIGPSFEMVALIGILLEMAGLGYGMFFLGGLNFRCVGNGILGHSTTGCEFTEGCIPRLLQGNHDGMMYLHKIYWVSYVSFGPSPSLHPCFMETSREHAILLGTQKMHKLLRPFP